MTQYEGRFRCQVAAASVGNNVLDFGPNQFPRLHILHM